MWIEQVNPIGTITRCLLTSDIALMNRQKSITNNSATIAHCKPEQQPPSSTSPTTYAINTASRATRLASQQPAISTRYHIAATVTRHYRNNKHSERDTNHCKTAPSLVFYDQWDRHLFFRQLLKGVCFTGTSVHTAKLSDLHKGNAAKWLIWKAFQTWLEFRLISWKSVLEHAGSFAQHVTPTSSVQKMRTCLQNLVKTFITNIGTILSMEVHTVILKLKQFISMTGRK